MNSGMNITTPRKAMLITKEVAFVMTKTRFWNIDSGMIASFARDSTQMNNRSDTALRANMPINNGEFHSYLLPPQVSASRKGMKTTSSRKAPAKSMGPRLP